MKDQNKTKAQLISELEEMRQRVSELEQAEVERKWTEKALWESEAKLRTVVEGSLQGILVHHKTKPLFVNKAYAKILGYESPDEILSMDSVVPLMAPHEQERLLSYQDARLKGFPAPEYYEYDAVSKDSSIVTLQHAVTTINWDNDTAVLSSVLDVTEHKRAEQAFQESEGRFRAIFEQAAVGVAQIESKTGDFVHINQKYADIVGYTVEEMEELTFQKITHPDDLQEDLDNMRRLLDGEIREFSMEKRYYYKNGSIVWVNLTVSPMWEIGEEPIYHIAVVEDITDRKQADAALQERVKELNCLYSVSRDMQEDLSIDELCRRTVEHLVPAMQFPEITIPVVELNGRRFIPENYTEGLSHGLFADIGVKGKSHGRLWVYYAEERPFLIPEEQNLVNGVAETISTWLEQKRAEEALRESEELFSRAFHSSPILMSTTHLENGLFIDVNERYIMTTGYSRKEILGNTSTDLNLWAGPSGREKMLGQMKAHGKVEGLDK